jgi:hypothetical protein
MSDLSLEFRLRRIHQRRRQALVRRLINITCWSVGLLASAALVVALSMALVLR